MGPQVIMGYQAGMKGNSSQAVVYWNTVAPIIHNQLRLFLDFFIETEMDKGFSSRHYNSWTNVVVLSLFLSLCIDSI